MLEQRRRQGRTSFVSRGLSIRVSRTAHVTHRDAPETAARRKEAATRANGEPRFKSARRCLHILSRGSGPRGTGVGCVCTPRRSWEVLIQQWRALIASPIGGVGVSHDVNVTAPDILHMRLPAISALRYAREERGGCSAAADAAAECRGSTLKYGVMHWGDQVTPERAGKACRLLGPENAHQRHHRGRHLPWPVVFYKLRSQLISGTGL